MRTTLSEAEQRSAKAISDNYCLDPDMALTDKVGFASLTIGGVFRWIQVNGSPDAFDTAAVGIVARVEHLRRKGALCKCGIQLHLGPCPKK